MLGHSSTATTASARVERLGGQRPQLDPGLRFRNCLGGIELAFATTPQDGVRRLDAGSA